MTVGDLERTPALETTFESTLKNRQILTSVATEVEPCCAEIKAKLDDLSVSISINLRKLRGLVISKPSTLGGSLKALGV